MSRDKTSLETITLKERLADLDNLPEHVLADEIIQNLEAGLNSFKEIATALS
jgi:type I restriction enzyme M protein